MTACIIMAAAALALIALALAPVRIEAACRDGIFTFTGRAGPVPVKLFPRERAGGRELERDAERDARKLFRRLPPPLLRLLAACGWRAACRLLPRSRVRRLYARYTAGGPDPYRAAMAYARAGLAMEGAARLVPHADLHAEADFSGGSSRFAGELAVSARGWAVLWAAGCFGMAFLRGYFQYQRKKEG